MLWREVVRTRTMRARVAFAIGHRSNNRLGTRIAMSALDQKQTFAPQNVMPALPPKADMCTPSKSTDSSRELSL